MITGLALFPAKTTARDSNVNKNWIMHSTQGMTSELSHAVVIATS